MYQIKKKTQDKAMFQLLFSTESYFSHTELILTGVSFGICQNKKQNITGLYMIMEHKNIVK